MNQVTITGVRIYDGLGNAATEPTSITIEGERIVAIGEAPRGDAVDARGHFLSPGLIQSHGHIMIEFTGEGPPLEPKPLATIQAVTRARRMIEAGITTFRDLSGYDNIELTLRRAIADGLIPGPRMICAGRRLAMTGGFFHVLGIEVDGPEGVRQAVRENWKAGVDLVKFVAAGGPNPRCLCCEPGGPEYTEEELRAGAAEAKRLNLRSAAHVVGPTSIMNSLRAGVDCLEHATYLDEEAAKLARKQGTHVVPTLSVYHRISANRERLRRYPVSAVWADKALEASFRTLELVHSHDLTIGMGTDAGTLMNPHGDMVTEFQLWRQAGIDFLRSLKAATSGGAAVCGLSDEVGTVRPGLLADLLLFDRDPAEDLEVLGRPVSVMQRGKIVHGRLP